MQRSFCRNPASAPPSGAFLARVVGTSLSCDKNPRRFGTVLKENDYNISQGLFLFFGYLHHPIMF